MNKKPEEKTQHERAFAMLGKKKAARKPSELLDVQHPAVKLYRSAIRPKYPDSVLIVNSLSDMYFSGEIRSKNGKSVSKNALIMEKAKKGGFEAAQPDLIIVQKVGKWAGLALELKREDKTVFKKNGELKKDDHIAAQAEYLRRLGRQGFYIGFAAGIDEVIEVFEKYFIMKLK